MNCRHCNHHLKHILIDLQHSPVSNDLLTLEQLKQGEIFYPLKVFICDNCFLVQIDEFKKSTEIFNNDYVYFSSYSSSWLAHCKKYVNSVSNRFKLNQKSLVVEIASNDGYLLQYFNAGNIPVLGIEPTQSTANVAIEKGINTIVDFFSKKFAKKEFANKKADLLIGNNVLAHVPDINDFVQGLKVALADDGVITMEFPHLLNLINQTQFDTIYHEHFSYLSLYAVKAIFEKFQLTIFDVEELSTHGGSLRIFAKHFDDESKKIHDNVSNLLSKELEFGITEIKSYTQFFSKVEKIKFDFVDFLVNAKKDGKSVAAYGAAAKGNTFLNYCGIKKDMIDFCVDASPYKQGRYMPGSHIPIVASSELEKQKPDYVLILPWNIKDEILKQHNYIEKWGAKFVTAIPTLEVI